MNFTSFFTKRLILSFVLFYGISLFGQDQDPKAKLILDDLSKKTKSYGLIEKSSTLAVARWKEDSILIHSLMVALCQPEVAHH